MDESVASKVAILLGIYEPVLMNDQCLDQAIRPPTFFVDTLISLIRAPKYLRVKFVDRS